MSIQIQSKHQNLWVYIFLHFFVDAASIMLVIGGLKYHSNQFQIILLYNILAFGLQLPFGYLFDKLNSPKIASITGVILLCLGASLPMYAWLAVILVGTGNALFHIGGGISVLNLAKGKAFLPGVFVSTGSLGLFFGGLLVKYQGYNPLWLLVLLALFSVLLFFIKTPTTLAAQKPFLTKRITYVHILITLFLLVIAIRSLVGLSLNFSWKINDQTTFLLFFSMFLGKGLGGFIADKWGWFSTTVISLGLASILFYFSGDIWYLALLGVVLFNISMPVTLVVVANCLKGKPGFAFGLTTFALLLGSLPTFFRTKSLFIHDNMIVFLIVISVIVLGFALNIYSKILK